MREVAKLINKIKHDKNYELAQKVFDLIVRNNQFKAYQLEGKSDVHGQLDSWLNNKYPNKEEFIEVFNNYIGETKSKLIACPKCGCPNFGNNCKHSETDLSNIKLKEEAEVILDNVLEINKDKDDNINSPLLN